jgi:DNA-binding NarL/FixJ family response regulator
MGYILKNEAIDTLKTALRNAFAGKLTFSEDALKELH